MFKIPVSDLLASYSGDSKEFSFSGEIYDGYLEDIQFLKPLEFSVKIIALDDGVSVIFHNLSTEVRYDWIVFSIEIGNFERTWKNFIDPLSDADDVNKIEGGSIDLGPVIREEIIMATMSI